MPHRRGARAPVGATPGHAGGVRRTGGTGLIAGTTWPPASVAGLRLRLPPDPWVFAVEDTAIQLTWRALPVGTLTATTTATGSTERARTATSAVARSDGGPGALELTGLPAGTSMQVVVTDAHEVEHRRRVTTLPSLPGPERFRFATLSDLHLSTRVFGFLNTIQERPHPRVASSERAAAAAVADAVAWGAELLVLKGDLTHRGTPEDWEAVARLIDACPVPVLVVPGNHDTKGVRGALDPDEQLSAMGVPLARPVLRHDAPGVRLVIVDTTRSGVDRGRFDHVADLALAALEGAGPAFLATHHQLQPLAVPVSWPPGIGAHRHSSFTARLAEVNPATMVSSGHTHRNRRRRFGPVLVTEVGSPKDYPGGWAGYVVHDEGIRQVVRRVSAPDVMAWTDLTATAAAHLWGRWSPGPLDHRCFVHRWPT